MKRFFLLMLGCFFLMPLFAQSRLKASVIYAGTVSSFGKNSNPNYGVSIGHQHHLINEKIFKMLMTENLEYKKAGFSYYDGGLGAGTSTSGDINFLNIKADVRGRIGKDFFVDFGTYTSYALSNSISDGNAVFQQGCFPIGPNQVTCPDPKNVTVINRFGNLDYGILFGAGFCYKNIVVNADIQGGLAKVVTLFRSITTLQQINLSVAFPISFKKKEVVK